MLNEKMLNAYIEENGNDVIEEVLTSLSLDGIQDVYEYGCSNGSASSYIYHHQTEAFFNKYSTECLENVERMKNEYRIDLNEFEFTKNNLCWLMIEAVVSDFINWCEWYYEEDEEEEN